MGGEMLCCNVGLQELQQCVPNTCMFENAWACTLANRQAGLKDVRDLFLQNEPLLAGGLRHIPII
eukprot:scaffold58774_cov18-Tisochrysis_lutea.AAC.1